MSDVVTLRLDVSGQNYFCPTFKTSAVQITKSVQSLRNITSAQRTVTEQTFRIPYSDELKAAIGDISDPGQSSNVDIRKNIQGAILINGFQEFEGSFNIISVTYNPKSTAKEAELVFKGNESSLKSQLENITLKELTEGETLDYSIAEIKSYYDDPDGYADTNGYAWDLIDYGQDFYADGGSGTTRIDDSATPLDQTAFKPLITVRKIFDLIESELDIELSTTTISLGNTIPNLMRQRIPLHNNENKLPAFDTSPLDFTFLADRTVGTTNSLASSQQVTLNFNRVDNFNQAVFNVTPDQMTIPSGSSGDYTFNFTYDFDISASTPGNIAVFQFGVYVNGSLVRPLAVIADTIPTAPTVNSYTGSVDFTLILFAGDTVDLRYEYGKASVGTYNIFATQNVATTFSCVKSPNFTSLSNVKVSESIDDELTAWDVVRTIIAQCNGILIRDTTTYTIIPWASWIDLNDDIININEIVDESRDIQIEPTSVTGAKSIRFTYEEGDDFYNEKYRELQGHQYGELFIPDTGSDFATEEYKIELPFTVGVPIPLDGNGSFPIIKMIDAEGEIVKNPPMLLPFSNNAVPQTMYIKDRFSGSTETVTSMKPLTHWQEGVSGGYNTLDLNFGSSLTFFSASRYPNNTLYERFWRRYIREVYGEKSRRYKMSVKLTNTQFSQLELNEILLLDNAFFRFNSIDNFNINQNEPVTIDIVKRIDLQNSDIAPYYPYDVIQGVVQWKDSSDNTDEGDGSGITPQSDLEESALAYGFFYDADNDIAIQVGQLLIS